jgi:hypothetical protein
VREIADGSHEFKVGVVMEDRETATFGRSGHECVDEGKRAVLATFGQELLELQCSAMVSVGNWNGLERIQTAGDGSVIVEAPSGEAKLKCHRRTQRHQAPCNKGRER